MVLLALFLTIFGSIIMASDTTPHYCADTLSGELQGLLENIDIIDREITHCHHKHKQLLEYKHEHPRSITVVNGQLGLRVFSYSALQDDIDNNQCLMYGKQQQKNKLINVLWYNFIHLHSVPADRIGAKAALLKHTKNDYHARSALAGRVGLEFVKDLEGQYPRVCSASNTVNLMLQAICNCPAVINKAEASEALVALMATDYSIRESVIHHFGNDYVRDLEQSTT